ncbi:TatD family hydrolase [Glutamicibacter sp. 287]|uniref:TatD family hydrolase n=1 Tax=unclassified Glutamicibacter TaxID=2627139 RepID=UPI000BB86636|nr:TatD family hydrolase [Glutamicibacter sp. BW80]PCC28063.1 deoxyribonuclease [Glutamicibacter sp. BW80]
MSESDFSGIPEGYRPAEEPNSSPTGELARSAKTEKNGSKRNTRYPEAPAPLPVPVIDNHTHLDFRDGSVNASVQQALNAAAAVGVEGLVQVGCDVESSKFAVQAAKDYPNILAAIAIHPNDAARLAEHGELEAAIEQIEALAANERVRAIGETGLDYFRTGEAGHQAQEKSFREHLRIAVEHGKAVQIHDRDAHHDVVRILNDAPLPERVVFHCFSGDAELARICNANGWYMSFSGTVTFKNSTDLQQALRLADPQLLLVETDAPFLTPHPFRGRPNASYMIPHTVRFMAETRDAELAQLCEQLAANTGAVYGAL